MATRTFRISDHARKRWNQRFAGRNIDAEFEFSSSNVGGAVKRKVVQTCSRSYLYAIKRGHLITYAITRDKGCRFC